MFMDLNDYELLYLISENNEKALNLMIYKYTFLIKKFVSAIYSKEDKEDLLQEGLIILYSCIKKYKMHEEGSFFSYFYISLKRHIYKIEKTSKNYNDMLKLEENEVSFNEEPLPYSVQVETEMEYKIVKDIFIENMSIEFFSQKYNINVKKIYNLIYKIKKQNKNFNG